MTYIPLHEEDEAFSVRFNFQTGKVEERIMPADQWPFDWCAGCGEPTDVGVKECPSCAMKRTEFEAHVGDPRR